MDDNLKYPFLFLHCDREGKSLNHYVVVAKHYDLRSADNVMLRIERDGSLYEPDIDLMGSVHKFSGDAVGEYEAKKFIQDWWSKINLSPP